MADSTIQVPPDSGGKKVDTSQITVAGVAVQRQRMAIGDDSTGAAMAAVKNGPTSVNDYGLVTRNIMATGSQADGHSETIGSTTDFIGATTLIGQIKGLYSRMTNGAQRTQVTDGTNNASVINATAAGNEYGLVTRNIPAGTQGASNAAGSQVDGHSATIGATTDLAGNNTLMGQTKSIASRMTDGAQRTKLTDGTNNVALSNGTPGSSDYGVVVRHAGMADTRNTSGSQLDGHSATIGATTDAESTNGNATLMAMTKNIRATLQSLTFGFINGTNKAIIRGGAKGSTAAADVTSTPAGSNNQALDVFLQGGNVPTGAATEATLATLTTPADTQPTSNAANTQLDGHSASIGATTAAESAVGNGTVIGLLKRIRTFSQASSVIVNASSASVGAALTLTIPAPPASTFHYITCIEITAYATAATAGGASPNIISSTNLGGAARWFFPSVFAIGESHLITFSPAAPLRSATAATATTIVCPAATSIIWMVTAYYSTGG